MKILHVIPAVAKRYGGPSTAIFPMCRALNAANCEAKICTTSADGQKTLPVRTGQWIEYEGVETIFFPATAKEFKYSREMVRWLDAHVSDFDVVHIHAVFNHSSIAAARACRKHSVPYIVRPLGTLDPWSMRQKFLKKKLFWSSFGKGMLARAAAVHYTTEAEKRAVEESLNVNHGVVVPLGVEIPQCRDFQSAIRNSKIGTPNLLFLSRLVPGKGIEILIEAFALLLEEPRFRQWRLLIAGQGDKEYVDSLNRLVRLCRIERSVGFLGWLEGRRKLDAVVGASLLVLPSQHENFGMSVVEAMAAAVPVLVSPHVSLADEIRRAGAGWIAPTGHEGLKVALAEALASRSKRLRRGKAAQSLAGRFRWPIVGQSLVQLYESIAN